MKKQLPLIIGAAAIISLYLYTKNNQQPEEEEEPQNVKVPQQKAKIYPVKTATFNKTVNLAKTAAQRAAATAGSGKGTTNNPAAITLNGY